MFGRALPWLVIILPVAAEGAEIRFDFDHSPIGQTPQGFRNVLSGQGKLGDWKVFLDEAFPSADPSASNASGGGKQRVLGQLSGDSTDERFPMLVYENEAFGDFRFTTRFRIVGGEVEQMAGVAFRIRDERNYYYLRASALGSNLRFFKVVDGQRSEPIGAQMEIRKGVWNELGVDCRGNQIQCFLNGQQVIPTLADNSFAFGKVAFWTKSDSIAHFTDARISYVPRQVLAEVLVQDALKRFERLIDLKLYAVPKGQPVARIIASKTGKDVGLAAGKEEQEVIARGVSYYGRGKQSVTVTLPLHDRNGESIAAAKITMKSFPGQTEQNAIVRALPIVRQMEARIRNATDLLE
ncbi:MAG: DUF1080 domain-containing protein [Verrucomicrobia bacterium]|nr:DUF1080 domain-containing protein [Verrucomicrobiota bacterium]